MIRPLAIILMSNSIIHADELADKAEKSIQKSINRIPALEILPAGSILKKINIPRYNPNYTPASLLTADQIKVISEEEVQGTVVGISLYDELGKIKTRTTLNAVNYNQSTGLITSRENLEFSGETFTASSQGLILDWENHRGFLLGKNKSIIYIKKRISMNNTNKPSTKTNTKKTRIATGATAAVLASVPALLTADELAKIEADSQPSTELFIKQLEQTKATLVATAEAEAKIATIRKELTEKLGSVPSIDPSQPAPPELVPIKGREFITITSDQLLFDAKKGVFVYFGNVKITHPQYSFTCDGELKIILNESASAKKLSEKERANLKPNDIFDDVKQIIATDNVIVRGKDKNGKVVTAVTENLSFTKETGSIILKGIGSRITTPDGQLKVVTNNGYLKLDENFNASGQGTDTRFNVPENDKKPEKPVKPNQP